MVPDRDTNVVFISELLTRRHPSIVGALKAALGDRLRSIPGTADIWRRDYMPIQVASDRFVQFRYDPDYLRDDPHLRTADGAGLLDPTRGCVRSDLVIDGGNVVHCADTVILTDKVYRENPGVERPKLRDDVLRLQECR
jgi:agmatine deiminase